MTTLYEESRSLLFFCYTPKERDLDAPIPRTVQATSQTLAVLILGGLHHQYIQA